MSLRQAAQQALEALENPNSGLVPHNGEWCSRQSIAITALRAALAEPEQEPMATKQMLRWVEHLKRLSDDGQHMNIPGLSSGACWELAIELEQFIKNTAPTPKPEQNQPLAWFRLDEKTNESFLVYFPSADGKDWRPLYAMPRNSLKDEAIESLRWCISQMPEPVLPGDYTDGYKKARAALAKVEASK